MVQNRPMRSAKLHSKFDSFLPATVAGISLLAGEIGFKLVPDTATYARRGIHLTPYPLSWIPGAIGGLQGVIIVNAVAVFFLLLLVPPGTPRRLLAAGGFYFFLFPGMDSLGALLVTLVFKYRNRLPYVVALGIHPVAAITTTPFLLRRTPRGFVIAFALVFMIVVSFAVDGYLRHEKVGVVSHIVYTVRYALPLLSCGTLLAEGVNHA